MEWENGWSKIPLLNSNSELELITSNLELELGTQTKKVKTFYSSRHIATVDKKEYNNGVLRIKLCACLMRYVRSVMRYTLSQGRTKPKSFGCSVRVHGKELV